MHDNKSISHHELMVCVCHQGVEDTAAAEEAAAAVHGAEEELLPCPICFKTCNSRLDLDAHMDTHPDTALRYTHIHASSSQMNTVSHH